MYAMQVNKYIRIDQILDTCTENSFCKQQRFSLAYPQKQQYSDGPLIEF